MVNIAVIDDGINEELYNIGELKYNIEILPELEIVERANYDKYASSHGTTCAAIIKKYAYDAILSSIKILREDTQKGFKHQLIKALEWCADNDIELVNLSLGTIDFRDFKEIIKAVGYARSKGVFIIAACNNKDIYTCPASLPEVIAVKCSKEDFLQEGEYIYRDDTYNNIEITSCSNHSIVDFNGICHNTSVCNSYAAPMITAIVYKIIEENPGISLEGIRCRLREGSLKQSRINKSCLRKKDFNIIDSIDVPIVTIYNYMNMEIEGLISELAQLFKGDGYNALPVINKHMEANRYNGIVPLYNYKINSASKDSNALKLVYAVYNPDVFLLAIEEPEKNMEIIKDIESVLDLDIKIFFLDNYFDAMASNSMNNNECIYIYITKNIDIPGISAEAEAKIIMQDSDVVRNLYSYIINLYNNL